MQRGNGAGLTEAEEQRVHTHSVHTEEAMGDEIGAKDDSLQWKHTETSLQKHQEDQSDQSVTSSCTKQTWLDPT